jgi:hypothetical protein
MNEAIDFVKNYDPINFGFGLWDLPIFISSVILSLVIFSYISKKLPLNIKPYFSKIGRLFSCLFVAFLFLKAVLNKDYWTILVLSIFLIPIFTKIKRIDDLFKMYDDFVDKRIIGK